MKVRISRPVSSVPTILGNPSYPAASRCRRKAWTVGVHAPVGRCPPPRSDLHTCRRVPREVEARRSRSDPVAPRSRPHPPSSTPWDRRHQRWLRDKGEHVALWVTEFVVATHGRSEGGTRIVAPPRVAVGLRQPSEALDDHEAVHSVGVAGGHRHGNERSVCPTKDRWLWSVDRHRERRSHRRSIVRASAARRRAGRRTCRPRADRSG